jgi:hypothetical protein
MVTMCTARFNTHQFYVLSTQCIYVFCVDLKTNSDYFPIQHQLTGFYNRDGQCLLRGTDWIFIRHLDPLKAVVTDTISRQPLTAEAQVPSQASPCEICG